MADVSHDPIGKAVGSMTFSSADRVDTSTSGNKNEETVNSAPVQSALVKLDEETVGPEPKPKRRDGKEARKRHKRQWNARKAAKLQAEKEEQIQRDLQKRLAMRRAQKSWEGEAAAARRMRSAGQIGDPWGFGTCEDETAVDRRMRSAERIDDPWGFGTCENEAVAARRMRPAEQIDDPWGFGTCEGEGEPAAARRKRSAEQIDDPWGFGDVERSPERKRVQTATINTPQHLWRSYQPERAKIDERSLAHSGNASSTVSTHKSKLFVPSDCRVVVLKENRSKFSVEEALDVRKFIMNSMLESSCTASFVDSGLIRQNTVYLLTCTDSETALKLINCCAQKATSRKWIVCLMNAIPIPTIIRGIVTGLILSKEKIIPFMKLVNGDLGLDFDSWKLVSFDEQGHKTTITIEVPEKDGEIVRKVGHLGLELTRVRFWILSKRRWQDDFEEVGASNQHLLGQPKPSGLPHNSGHGPTASPILSAEKF